MGKYVKTLSKSSLWGVDLLIFVTLGTQDKPFPRLLEKIENEIKCGNIKEKVIVQAGHTKFESEYMQILGMLTMEEYQQYMKECDLLITHGGVGSIFDALKLGKKIIACPRLKKYNEHLNDHQIQLIEAFQEKGYLLAYNENNLLSDVLNESKKKKPIHYKTNNHKMVKIITDFIENN